MYSVFLGILSTGPIHNSVTLVSSALNPLCSSASPVLRRPNRLEISSPDQVKYIERTGVQDENSLVLSTPSWAH